MSTGAVPGLVTVVVFTLGAVADPKPRLCGETLMGFDLAAALPCEGSISCAMLAATPIKRIVATTATTTRNFCRQ